MNKKRIEKLLPAAHKALADTGIAENGRIDKSFRGQISSFGAAVTTGSLLAAVAFFSDQGSAKVKRDTLINAIYLILTEEKLISGTSDNLFEAILNEEKNRSRSDNEMKELVLDCAIAIKLAMNLYELKSDKTKKEGSN